MSKQVILALSERGALAVRKACWNRPHTDDDTEILTSVVNEIDSQLGGTPRSTGTADDQAGRIARKMAKAASDAVAEAEDGSVEPHVDNEGHEVTP